MKLIASCMMILVGLLFIGVAMLKNRKSHWVYASLRTLAVAVAAALGVLLVNLACGLVAGAVYSSLEGSVLLEKFAPLFESVPSFSDLFRAIVGCVLGVVLFVPVFLILKGVLYLAVRPLARTLIPMVEKKTKVVRVKTAVAEEAEAVDQTETEDQAETKDQTETEDQTDAAEVVPVTETKEKKKKTKTVKVKVPKEAKAGTVGLHTKEPNLFGTLIGALCGFLVFVAIFAPMVGIVTVVSDVASLGAVMASDEEADDAEDAEDAEDAMETKILMEAVDAAANNVGCRAIYLLGGKPIFAGLTTYSVGGHRMSLVREVNFVTLAARAVVTSLDEEASHSEAAELYRRAGKAFTKTDALPVMIPEIMQAASENWDRGETFCGFGKPSFGAGLDVFMNPFMDILKDATYGTVKEDVKTLFDVMATVAEKDAMNSLSEDPIRLFGDREFNASLLRSLLENPRMCRMVDGFLTFGFETMGESFGMYQSSAEIYESFISDLTDATRSTLEGCDPSEAVSRLSAGYARVFESYAMRTDASAPTLLAEAVMSRCVDDSVLYGNRLPAAYAETALPMADGSVFCITVDTVSLVSELVAVDQMEISSDRVTDPAKEADALASALCGVVNVMDDLDGADFSVGVAVRSLGSVLDDLAKTETVGGATAEKLLLGLLQSKNVLDSTGLSLSEVNDIAHTIIENSGTKGYAPLLLSLSHTMDVLSAANDPDVDLSERVEVLMASMTVESARVMQTLSKPSLMISNGVAEENAEASANMMSNMFGNLATMGADMSEEEYRRESSAVSHVTNLAMNTGLRDCETTFGEGSATGVSAAEYVNDSLDSLVVSTTVRETVYPDGATEPVLDPLNTQMSMTASEQEEFLAALNDRFATEADPTNAEVRQNYVALGSMLNVSLVVTENGVELA